MRDAFEVSDMVQKKMTAILFFWSYVDFSKEGYLSTSTFDIPLLTFPKGKDIEYVNKHTIPLFSDQYCDDWYLERFWSIFYSKWQINIMMTFFKRWKSCVLTDGSFNLMFLI